MGKRLEDFGDQKVLEPFNFSWEYRNAILQAVQSSAVTTCKFYSDPKVEKDKHLLRYWNAAIPLSFITGVLATFAVVINEQYVEMVKCGEYVLV